MRPLIAGLAAALPLAAGAAEQPRRPPDAHDRGGPRTDVVDIGAVIAPDHYVAPVAGWRYRPLRVGERLAPAYYRARYRIAGVGARRWIRYGDDLVLVDVGAGEVLRIVRGGYRPR